MDNEIILVGGFHEMIELCEKSGFVIKGIIDGNLKGEYYGYPVIGSDDDAMKLFSEYGKYKIVLTPDSPQIRQKLVRLYSSIGYGFATIISPKATISKFATIGEGTIIQDFVNVSAGTKVGRFVKLNTYCNIMHDNDIDDYSTVAPNAVSLGRIKICKSAYIGSNATILPGLTIGNMAIIGAGAVVTKNIEDSSIAKGIPAKAKKINDIIAIVGGGKILICNKLAYHNISSEEIKENRYVRHSLFCDIHTQNHSLTA